MASIPRAHNASGHTFRFGRDEDKYNQKEMTKKTKTKMYKKFFVFSYSSAFCRVLSKRGKNGSKQKEIQEREIDEGDKKKQTKKQQNFTLTVLNDSTLGTILVCKERERVAARARLASRGRNDTVVAFDSGCVPAGKRCNTLSVTCTIYIEANDEEANFETDRHVA